MDEKVRYYGMDGKPLPGSPIEQATKWEEMLRDRKQVIRRSRLQKGQHFYSISTILLGIDFSFMGGKPIIFETMVFSTDETWNEETWRYYTKRQAQRGHWKIKRIVRLYLEYARRATPNYKYKKRRKNR